MVGIIPSWLPRFYARFRGIATSLSIEVDDFEYTPFDCKGGQLKAVQLFGQELNSILIEYNAVLAA
jgi:type I restriction enzyme R subunit